MVKRFDTLPEAAREIRTAVFMEEQGFREEFDELDGESVHLVLYCQGEPAAVARVYWDGEEDAHVIGRIAVVKQRRGTGLGRQVVEAGEALARDQGGKRARLAAQVQAAGFYEKMGYCRAGEEFLEEHCPHIWMEKEI